MRIKLSAVLLALSLMVSYCAVAEDLVSLENSEIDEGLTTAEDAIGFSNKIIMNVSRARFEEAWNLLKSNTSIPAARIDEFAKEYDSNYVRTIQYFGPSTGVELINQAMSGKSMLKITYLVKYEITGVAWHLYFYRVKDKWLLSEYNYDLNSSSLFESVASNDSNPASFQLLFGQWQAEIEKRLDKVESNPAPTAQRIDFSSLAMDDKELALLNLLESRLAELERKYTETEKRIAELEAGGADKDSGELFTITDDLAMLKRVVNVLKKQHPYADFPSR